MRAQAVGTVSAGPKKADLRCAILCKKIFFILKISRFTVTFVQQVVNSTTKTHGQDIN